MAPSSVFGGRGTPLEKLPSAPAAVPTGFGSGVQAAGVATGAMNKMFESEIGFGGFSTSSSFAQETGEYEPDASSVREYAYQENKN